MDGLEGKCIKRDRIRDGGLKKKRRINQQHNAMRGEEPADFTQGEGNKRRAREK